MHHKAYEPFTTIKTFGILSLSVASKHLWSRVLSTKRFKLKDIAREQDNIWKQDLPGLLLEYLPDGNPLQCHGGNSAPFFP